MVDRLNQPRCQSDEGCNHPRSFHGTRGKKTLGRCKALGCRCSAWVAPVDASKSS